MVTSREVRLRCCGVKANKTNGDFYPIAGTRRQNRSGRAVFWSINCRRRFPALCGRLLWGKVWPSKDHWTLIRTTPHVWRVIRITEKFSGTELARIGFGETLSLPGKLSYDLRYFLKPSALSSRSFAGRRLVNHSTGVTAPDSVMACDSVGPSKVFLRVIVFAHIPRQQHSESYKGSQL